MKTFIKLRVNGETYEVAVAPQRTLLEVLREDLGLTGAKEACGLGTCGACTILVDGQAALSCLMLAHTAVGKQILTIEGLAKGRDLHPLQQAFLDHGSVQCGFCSPGMILSAKSLLDENPTPSEEEIRLALAGNLCRCVGYAKIVAAVKSVAQKAP
ncbi:MAG: (2Fe-2S)-binding protein [Desulfobacterales bacterium]|nr:(2Fe-2S)-binding protein [Desulfobacterales bacterium]